MMQRDADADVESPLRRRLRRCVDTLEETVRLYGHDEAAVDDGFVSTVMVAAAAITQAAEATRSDPARPTAFAVAARVAPEAAASLRAYGLDEQLLRAAEACERAARLCQAQLDR